MPNNSHAMIDIPAADKKLNPVSNNPKNVL